MTVSKRQQPNQRADNFMRFQCSDKSRTWRGNFIWLLINHAFLFLSLQTIQGHLNDMSSLLRMTLYFLISLFNTFVLTNRNYLVIFLKIKMIERATYKIIKNVIRKKIKDVNSSLQFFALCLVLLSGLFSFAFFKTLFYLIEHMISQWTNLDLFCNRWRKQYMYVLKKWWEDYFVERNF